MKFKIKNLVFLFVILQSFISCNSGLKPEGKLEDKELKFSNFTNVKLSGNFRVIFIQDSISKVRLETFSNLIENLKIKQDGEKLIFNEEKNVSGEVEVYNVYIHAKHISNVTAQDNILIDAPSLIKNQEVNIELTDNVKFIGEIQSQTLNLDIKDNADINLKGSTVEFDLEANDQANFKAPFFVIDKAEINLSDISQAEINVKSELSGVIKDNSTLNYIGNPSKDVEQKDLAKIQEKK